MTVGDLGQVFDGPHATPTRRADGDKYFLSISSLVDGRLDLSRSDRVDDVDFARWTRRVQPEEGDLLFSYETRLGEAALMPTGVEACLGRRMALLRPDRAVVDPRFLLYAWLSPTFQQTIADRSISGATVDRIPLTELASWPVNVQALPVQRAIAEVLGSLDDKIAASRRVMTSADCLGRQLARRDTVGGVVRALSDITELVTRGVTPRYAVDGYLVLNQKCIRNGRVDTAPARRMASLPKSNGKILRPSDVLVNSTGQGTLGRVARWTRDEGDVSVDTHVSIVRVDRSKADPDYVGVLLLDRAADIEALAEGSTGQTELRREALEALPLRLPSLDRQHRAGEQIRSMTNLADTLDAENQRLAATRDELLPLLMSGRITVKDAERRVEDET